MRAKGYLSVLVTSVLAAAFLFTAGGCAKETRRESEPTKPNAAADAPPPSESGVVTVKKQSSYDILQKDPHGILVAKTTVTNTEVCVGGNLYLQTVVVPAGTLTVTPTGRMCKE